MCYSHTCNLFNNYDITFRGKITYHLRFLCIICLLACDGACASQSHLSEIIPKKNGFAGFFYISYYQISITSLWWIKDSLTTISNKEFTCVQWVKHVVSFEHVAWKLGQHLFTLETPGDLLTPDLVNIAFGEIFHSLVDMAAPRWNIPFVDILFNKREWKSGNVR